MNVPMNAPADTRHFLDLDTVNAGDLRHILDQAKDLKAAAKAGEHSRLLDGKTIALIFEKPSTRTRVSFEVGIKQMGGDVIVLNADDMQLSRGESTEDTARVLSRYVDAIMIRTTSHERLLKLAEHATVPVINGLTDRSHPCQLMADVLTIEEHRGPVKGQKIAWCGDSNNVGLSWMHAASRFDFELAMAVPAELDPADEDLAWANRNGKHVTIHRDPLTAAKDADAVVTDVWVSMGDEDAASRHNMLKPYQVNDEVMAGAKDDSVFLHCLPAIRDQEVTDAVIDGPQSVVFDEAENRLHAQKAVLAWCLNKI